MGKLIKRTISGIIYVLLIIAAFVTIKEIYLIVFSLILVLALTEFSRLTNKSDGEKGYTLILDIIGGLVMFGSLYAYASDMNLPNGLPLMAPYIIYFLVRFTIQLYSKEAQPLMNLAMSMMGQMYVALPLSLLSLIFFKFGGEYVALGLFVFIWVNDTGAYCVGSMIGKHKMIPRLSPKKSWEGLIGGFVFCVAAAFIFSYLRPELMLWQWLLLSLVAALFSTWGDLSESLIKRTLDVKDSGNIMPGHGGILDRIDSVLLVVPAALTLLMFIL